MCSITEEGRFAPKAWRPQGFKARPSREELLLQQFYAWVSGGLSGCLAKTVTAPFSRITILIQTSSLLKDTPTAAAFSGSQPGKFQNGRILESLRTVCQTEGGCALWKGHLSTCLHRFSFTGCNFVLFQHLSKYSDRDLANGAVAGTVATGLCYPLEVVRARIMAERWGSEVYRNPWRCLNHIHATEGVIGMYRGLPISLVVSVPAVSISFKSFRFFKAGLPSGLPCSDFVAGGLSGICSSVLIFPIDTVRRRLQVSGMGGLKSGVLAEATRIYKKEGPWAFYRGIRPELLKIFLTAGITFGTFEWLMSK